MLALAWLALAPILEQVGRNSTVGIRTPWALTSDENWARIHRVAALAMTLGALVALVASVFGVFPVALIALIGSAFVPRVYSYLRSGRPPPAG